MKFYKYLLLLIPLFATQSCFMEMALGEDPNGLVGLEAHIAGVSLLTRGGAVRSEDISSLGIYAVNTADGESSYGIRPAGTYRKYKIENNAVSADGEALRLNHEKATIYSFHPVVADGADPDGSATIPTIKIPMATIVASRSAIAGKEGNNYDFADAANDYMYGVTYNDTLEDGFKFLSTQPVADNGRYFPEDAPDSQKGPAVSIGLKHAFAQIRFDIRKGVAYQGLAAVSQVDYRRTMQTLSADGSTTMNLTDGQLNNLTDAASTTYSFAFATSVEAPSTIKNETFTLTNYVIPNAAAASEISITVDGKVMKLPYSADPAWEAGKIYAYTITILPTGLEMSGFNVVSWNDMPQGPSVII